MKHPILTPVRVVGGVAGVGFIYGLVTTNVPCITVGGIVTGLVMLVHAAYGPDDAELEQRSRG